jgi:tetratricopeptide (TPR) repeat protein
MASPTELLTASDWEKIDHAAHTLPRPVAQSPKRFLETGGLANIFFSAESLLRFLCLAVKSAYLTSEDPPSEAMNDLLRKHTTHPSMGNWFHFLGGFAKRRELVDRYWPFAEGVVMLSELLPCAEPLLNARTRLHGHAGRVLSEAAEAAAIREYAPKLALALARVAFLAKSPLLVQDSRSGEWNAWMGQTAVPCTPPVFVAGHSPAVLVGLPRGALSLFPLTVSTFEGYQTLMGDLPEAGILSFDGVDVGRKRLEYVGGEGGRRSDTRWFEDYRALMNAHMVPMVRLVLDKEPSVFIQQQVSAALQDEVERLTDENRWQGDDVRLDLEVCGLIDDALASTASLAFVCGEAGAGKTTHLLSAALRAQRRGEAALFVPARQLLEDRAGDTGSHAIEVLLRTSLEHRLRVLGSLDGILGHAAASSPEGRVSLFVDGLDELGGARAVKVYLDQLADWVRRTRQRLPNLCIVASMRGAYRDALELLGFRLRDLGGQLYRPTRRDAGGGDVVEDAIWLRPAATQEIERRYEAFRVSDRGLCPEIAFKALHIRIQRACANPRWMVGFLRRFHGERWLPANSPIDLIRAHVDDAVYALTGMPLHAVFPDRVAFCEAFVRAERAGGVAGARLESVLVDPAVEVLVQRGRESEVLLELQSAGILRVEAPADDPFTSPFLRASDELIGVVLHLKERSLRNGTPEDWATVARGTEELPIGEFVGEAVAQRFVDHICSGGHPPSLALLPPSLAADALVRLSSTDVASLAHGWLRSCEPEVRETVAHALVSHARATGIFAALHDLAVGMTNWPAEDHTPATIELAGRGLRHAEAIDQVEGWLTTLAESGTAYSVHARFLLAEVLRDKGQWRSAAGHYDCVTSTVHIPPDMRLLATAARGECYVWLQEPDVALRYLSQAETLLAEDTAPDVRCSLFIKQGIAERVRGKPVRATRALVVAEELADRHNLVVERAKVELELGLVASLLLGHDEAERRVRSALERHSAQGFIKGRKKGWYSLGYVLERAGRTSEAIHAYEESLRLNEHPETFDLLGRALCHGALARMLKQTDQERAFSHQNKSDEANARLQRKDQNHAPVL